MQNEAFKANIPPSDSIYVRCRDGALYENPVFVFPEGFICFSGNEPPELVLWVFRKAPCEAVLRRIFGMGPDTCSADLGSIGTAYPSMRVVPGSDPWEYQSAVAYYFELLCRIPRPTEYGGQERYRSRVKGSVLDLPAHQLDALYLEIQPD